MLAKHVQNSNGKLHAIWVIDQKGFSVAQSTPLQHYWFGDLSLFKNTIKAQPSHWYIGRSHQLKNSQERVVELALPITGKNHKTIGVLAAEERIG